jgi:excisionase family DNA binding protein
MDKVRSLDELPVTLRVEDLTSILDIGRNTAYELVRSGHIKSVRVGRQIRIPKDAVQEFLQRQRDLK